ncbi:nucleotide sugar dehydrogenase [Nitrospira moscoviensis]|uniref:UDP-glucose/GDP-mannose dehydrogenase family protein n=1 Tax=Nitrospira moscoviensis TaxID=42253 RepID=A0A0K2GGL3_NITMO|nr:nucleotide sugar dehydrogenase [Nitrospira moscoviensis]ALA59762.1 UDP-glucose/GDP-mannose dehydrogenase family protein [Nitrospira moscoviensis]
MERGQARSIAVVGLGYVGLPIAVAFGKQAPVIGFDINRTKIEELRKGLDRTGEVSKSDLNAAKVHYTWEPAELKRADFIIVAVPTPINEALQPDLTALQKSSELIGRNLSAGTIVVYESTVYPGATEEVCLPILEKTSGMKAGVDFKIGYSPERINPGDKEHTLEKIVKVVSAQDAESLEIVARTYASVVKAGIHRASSIKVAEAAKVIENTQRDLNIALMNELSLIFHRLGIDTKSVLEAAGTKWNFLKFSPGLVGGHCIGVDPYYLTTKAESVGYHPQVILAGRRINNGMGKFVAEHTMKLLSQLSRPVSELRVGVLGLTFKENVPDLRNSKVPDIIHELREYGVTVVVHDPMAEPEEAVAEYGIHLSDWKQFADLDGLILAVAHRHFLDMGMKELLRPLRSQKNGVLIDVKSVLDPGEVPGGLKYWRL